MEFIPAKTSRSFSALSRALIVGLFAIVSLMDLAHAIEPSTKASIEQKSRRDFNEYRRLTAEVINRNFASLFSHDRHIIGVEFILAGPSLERPESFFGHAMLRFVDDDANIFNDFVLSFIADNSDLQYSATKAFLGQYPAEAQLLDVGTFMREYIYGEGRYLERWPLQLTAEQIESLIVTLQQNLRSGRKFGDYYFVGRNCASILARLLTEAGLPETLHLLSPQSPEDVPRYLTMRKLATLPPIVSSQAGWVVNAIAERFGLNYKDVKAGRMPPEVFSYLRELDFNTLAHVTKYLPIERSPELFRLVAGEIRMRRQKGETVRWGLETLPAALYQLCTEESCIRSQLALAREVWGRQFDLAYLKQNAPTYSYDGLKDPRRIRSPHDWALKTSLEMLRK